jgi:hypothetical protein
MIKIEVSGASIAEVSDKLLAIGASLQRTEKPEVAEAAPINPTPAPKSARSAEETESQPTTTQPSTTPAPTAVTEEPASSGQTEASAPPTEEKSFASAELNFDTDVAPIVLQVVKEKGKPVVQEILEQFGVERASLLDPARWPELVDQLKDAL